ncbi:MAG TPA: lysoplasmalogenase [Pseudomonadota bacterium]|nr:lysoplasmalogenase [Pseudomonadota bacterium]
MISKARGLLLSGLSLVWGGSLLGSFAVLPLPGPGASRIPFPLKLLSSAALAVAGLLIRGGKRKGAAAHYSDQIAKGMAWGFVGDVCMRFSVPLGMLTFGLGHIAYSRGMWRLGGSFGARGRAIQLAAWATWLSVGAASFYWVVHKGPKGGTPLAWAALPYTLLLSTTAGLATGLALQKARFVPLAVGAAAFLASDLLIAMRMFQPEWFAKIPDSVRGDLVWLLYGPGQALIVSSALFVDEE